MRRRFLGAAVAMLVPVPWVYGAGAWAAWEADGFRSGMTLAQAMTVLQSHGLRVDARIGIGGEPKNAYFLSLKARRGSLFAGPDYREGEVHAGGLEFCSDVLYRYFRYISGGFEQFVMRTEYEARRRGAPTLESNPPKAELEKSNPGYAAGSITARWGDESRDSLAITLDKSYGKFYLSIQYEDRSVCPD